MSKFYIITALIIASLYLSIAPAHAKKAAKPTRSQAAFTQASEYEQLLLMDKAEEFYLKAIAADPKHNMAMFRLASIYDRKHDFSKAAELYKKILINDPKFLPAKNNLAIDYFMQGNTSEAVAQWRDSLRLNPYQPDVYTNIGKAYMKVGDYEGAIKNFDFALKLKPLDLNASNSRASALFQSARYKEADEQYSSNIGKFSYEPMTKYNYARFCIYYENYAKAVTLLQNAIKIRNNLGFFYTALAEAQIHSNSLAEASVSLEKAEAAEIKAYDYDRVLALYFHKKNDLVESLRHYNKAYNSSSRGTETVSGLGRLYIDMGQSAKALELWADFLSKKDDLEVRNVRAKYFISSGNTSQALTDLNHNLSKAPNNFRSLYLMGKVSQLQNNSLAAENYYKKAIDNCPYLMEAAVSLAELYTSDKNYSKALDILNESAQKNPASSLPYLGQGIVYKAMGNDTMALSSWMKGLSIDGTQADIYYHLARHNDPLSLDEAIRYYDTYLRLAPEGQYAAEVKKRLSQIR